MYILDTLFFNKKSASRIQYDYLDGLRGIAVLFVLLSHLGLAKFRPFYFIDFSGSGKYGVFLFFVLSSFLLTLPLLDLSVRSLRDARLWMNYVTRRFLRIFPLYTVVLTVSYLFRSTGYFKDMTRSELIDHLLLLKGKFVYWTIPVEFKYYFVLPFVGVLFILLRKNIISSSIVIAGGILTAGFLLWPADPSKMNTLSLGPYLPIFLLGSLSALVVKRAAGKRLEHPLIKAGAELCGFLLLCTTIILIPDNWERLSGVTVRNNFFHKDFLLFGCIWSFFIICSFFGTGLLRRALSAKPLRFLGIIGFSIYLWHIPVILFMSHTEFNSVAKAWISILMTIIVSSVSFLLIEKPFMKIKLFKVSSVKNGLSSQCTPVGKTKFSG